MKATEILWRCPFDVLPAQLKVRFLVEENAYFRWEDGKKKGIPGNPVDDWLWAENEINLTYPHLVISALEPTRRWIEEADWDW